MCAILCCFGLPSNFNSAGPHVQTEVTLFYDTYRNKVPYSSAEQPNTTISCGRSFKLKRTLRLSQGPRDSNSNSSSSARIEDTLQSQTRRASSAPPCCRGKPSDAGSDGRSLKGRLHGQGQGQQLEQEEEQELRGQAPAAARGRRPPGLESCAISTGPGRAGLSRRSTLAS